MILIVFAMTDED